VTTESDQQRFSLPGVFRGALDCRAATITTTMYMEAATAIAALVKPSDLNREHIIPSVFDERVAAVAVLLCNEPPVKKASLEAEARKALYPI